MAISSMAQGGDLHSKKKLKGGNCEKDSNFDIMSKQSDCHRTKLKYA